MEHIAKMLEDVKDDMEQRLVDWKQAKHDINDLQVKEAFNSLKANITTEEASIVITYLRSSYITGTHQFKIALYENVPFMNEATLYRLVDLTPLYQRTPELIDQLTKKIRFQFKRIMPYEIEEIRRFCMEYFYKNSCFFFEKVLENIENDAETISIYFGEEIGQIEKIGVI